MKSPLTPDETAALIQEAIDAYPDGDYAASVDEWYQDKGFITEDQEAALNSVIRKSEERPSWMRDD